MNRKISFLLLSVLTLSIYSCKKDAATASLNNITLQQQKFVFDGFSGAYWQGTNNDSLFIATTNKTSITGIPLNYTGFLTFTTTNVVAISLITPNIAIGTYTNGDNAVAFKMGANLNQIQYTTHTTDRNTLTISSKTPTSISGSYSAKVFIKDNLVDTGRVVTGNFSTDFLN